MSSSNYTRPAKNGKPGPQYSSANSTLASQASFSLEENDKLLDWIDSLKSRVHNTFDKQKQEHEQLVQESNQERIRQQYREQLSSAAFDKLGQILNAPLQKRQNTTYTRTANGIAESGDESEGIDDIATSQEFEIAESVPIDLEEESFGSGVEDEHISEDQGQDPESPRIYDEEGEVSDDAIEILSDDSEPNTTSAVKMSYLQGRPRITDHDIYAERDKYYDEDGFDEEMEENSEEAEEAEEAEDFEEFEQFGNGEAEAGDSANEDSEAEDSENEDFEAVDSENEALDKIVELEAEEIGNYQSEKEVESGNEGFEKEPEFDHDMFEDYQYSEAEASKSLDHEVFANENSATGAVKVHQKQPLSSHDHSLSFEEKALNNEQLDQLAASGFLAEEALARYSEHALKNSALVDNMEDIEEVIKDVEMIKNEENSAHNKNMRDQDENDIGYYEHAMEEEDSEEVDVFHDTETLVEQPIEQLTAADASLSSADSSLEIADSFMTAGDNGELNSNFYSVMARNALEDDQHGSTNSTSQPIQMTTTPIQGVDNQYSSEDELMNDAKENMSDEAEPLEDAYSTNDAVDTSVNESTISGENLISEIINKPPTPIFRSISAEEPLETLKTLREAEKRYKIKLDSVRNLKSELNLPSDSSDTGSVSEGESHASNAFAHLNSKPEVPVLEEISDSSEAESSDDESESRGVYVDEPILKEETVVLYDEYTEFAPGISLQPSSVEEPEQSGGIHTAVTSVFKFVEDSDDEPLIKPTEVLEPSEPPEDIVVETMEEATDVILPTHIEEFEEVLVKQYSTEASESEQSRKRPAEVDENPSPLKRIKKIFQTLNPFSWSKSENAEITDSADNSDNSLVDLSDHEVEEAISEEITELIVEELNKVDTLESDGQDSGEAKNSENEMEESHHQGSPSGISQPLVEAVEYVSEVVDMPVESIQEEDISQDAQFESGPIEQVIDASNGAMEYIEKVIEEPIEDIDMKEDEDEQDSDHIVSSAPIVSQIEDSIAAQKEALETAVKSASKVLDAIDDVVQEPVDEKPFVDAIRKERAQRLKAVVEHVDQKVPLTQSTHDDNSSIADALRPVTDAVDYLERVVEGPAIETSNDEDNRDVENLPLAEAASAVVEKVQEAVEEPAVTDVNIKQSGELRMKRNEESAFQNEESTLQNEESTRSKAIEAEPESDNNEPKGALEVVGKVLGHLEEVIDSAVSSPTSNEQESCADSSPMEDIVDDNNKQFSDALGPASAVFEHIESAVEAPFEVSDHEEYEDEAEEIEVGESEEEESEEEESEEEESEDDGKKVNDKVNELEDPVDKVNEITPLDATHEQVQDTAQKSTEDSMECDDISIETEEIQTSQADFDSDSPKDPFVAVAETLDYVGELKDTVQSMMSESKKSENGENSFKAFETPIQAALGHLSSELQGTLEPVKDIVECIESNVEAPIEDDLTSSEDRIRQFRQEKLKDFANSLKVPIENRSSLHSPLTPSSTSQTQSVAPETEAEESVDEMSVDESLNVKSDESEETEIESDKNSEQEADSRLETKPELIKSNNAKSPRHTARTKTKSTDATEQIFKLLREKADEVLARKMQEASSKVASEVEQSENEDADENKKNEVSEANDPNGHNAERENDEPDKDNEGESESRSESESESYDSSAGDPDDSFAPNMSDMDIEYSSDDENETPRVTRSGRYLRSMGPAPKETNHIPIPKKAYGHDGEDTEPEVKKEVKEEETNSCDMNEQTEGEDKTDSFDKNEHMETEGEDKTEPRDNGHSEKSKIKGEEKSDPQDNEHMEKSEIKGKEKSESHDEDLEKFEKKGKEKSESHENLEKSEKKGKEKSESHEDLEKSEKKGKEKSAKVKIERSSPAKKPRRNSRNTGGKYLHQVNTVQDFESPAFRTRSKSPIKRSIQELTSAVKEEPVKKRPRGRPRKQKPVTPADENEVNSRGRERNRN